MTFLLTLLIFVGVFFNPGQAAADIHVLIYHRFGEDNNPSTNVSISSFKKQMEYLEDNDYDVVPLSYVADALKDNRQLPEKTVVITVDDGYESVYTNAWPILKKYGYPFTVFLNILGVNDRYKSLLNWEQITEMHDAGVDIQDHSYSHLRLANWPKGMDENDYRKWIRNDLQKGADVIAMRLGEKPKYLALPYGEYNHIVIDEAVKYGYEAILTQDPGAVSSETSRFRMPREPILGNEWISMEHFKMILERQDMPCFDESPPLLPLENEEPIYITARLLHPQNYESGSMEIYISELGWLPATLKDDQLSTRQPVTLHRRMNRIAIEAKDKESGRTAIRFWMLLRSSGK